MTKEGKSAIISMAGQAEAGSVEAQPARNNRLKATNCNRSDNCKTAAPVRKNRQFRALPCLKKPDKKAPPKAASIPAEGRNSQLNVKRFCPIHAEPGHLEGPAIRDLFPQNGSQGRWEAIQYGPICSPPLRVRLCTSPR